MTYWNADGRESIKVWNPPLPEQERWADPKQTAQMLERVEQMLAKQAEKGLGNIYLLEMDVRHLLNIAGRPTSS